MDAAGLHRWLLAQWFGPDARWLAFFFGPPARMYGWLAARRRRRLIAAAQTAARPAIPIVVVGNLVVGGAGKTPTTVAIVEILQRAGRRPGVLSRGYGRKSSELSVVDVHSTADDCGDEPILIARRTAAPVVVGQDRMAALDLMLRRQPEVDVIVADDGLQHRRLPRDLEVLVFDNRGIGNGRLLPAGPLREPFGATPPPRSLVVYTEGRRSTAWDGHLARRVLGDAALLADWLRGAPASRPLQALRGRRMLAMAGLAVPERFFGALEAAGLTIERLPLPDHFAYPSAPWPESTDEIITTEKDAVKLARWSGTGPRIWVVRLDLALPTAFEAELLERIASPVSP